MSKQEFRPHEAARIKVGKHAGLVGTVIETRPETGMVKIKVEGVWESQPIDFEKWMAAKSLEHHA